MATFLDRRALKKILDAANAIRKVDGAAAEETLSVYLMRGDARRGRPLQALQALHSVAVEAFGGRAARETSDGLTAAFRAPIDALRAALHALHAVDLAADILDVPRCRVAIAQGTGTLVERPIRDLTGPALERAVKIAGRARAGEAVLEETLYSTVRADIEGHADIEIAQPRRGRIPGLGVVTTVSIKPIGLKPEREEELLDVDAELRARGRR